VNQRSVRRIKKQLTRRVMVKGEWKDIAPDRSVVQRIKRAWAQHRSPAQVRGPYRPTRKSHRAWVRSARVRRQKAGV
jgi:hypothetical protein